MTGKSAHIAIVATHPIQYQAPWFRALARCSSLDMEVLFCSESSPAEQAQAGFGVEFEWDVPLLDGYPHRFLRNAARSPSVNSFFGLDTPEIGQSVASGRYDAVVISGWHYKTAWQTIRACWRANIPVLVRGDSHLRTPRSSLKSAAKHPFYSWFIPRFDGCLPVGRWSREYFLHYGARPERVFAVPHTIDLDRISGQLPHAKEVSELRLKWGLPEEAVVFLFAGKFIEKKRPMDFIQAVIQANRSNPQIWGLMAGDGPLRSECQAKVNESASSIRFAGFLNQTEIAAAYKATDALVLPSDGRETWGLVVNEAMASGRPCFVADCVGCGPDLIDPGLTGDIFATGDVAALARLLIASADRDRLTVMGCNARTKSSGYSPEAAAHALAAAVNHTLQRTRG